MAKRVLWADVPESEAARPKDTLTAEHQADGKRCPYAARPIWMPEKYAPCRGGVIDGESACFHHRQDPSIDRSPMYVQQRAISTLRRNVHIERLEDIRGLTEVYIDALSPTGPKVAGVIREIRDLWTDEQIIAKFPSVIVPPDRLIDHFARMRGARLGGVNGDDSTS